MNRVRRRRILIAAAVLAVIGFVVWSLRRTQPEIVGRVTLDGTPRPEIQITLDPTSAKLRTNGLTTRHFLVSSNGGLANAFVYIRSGLSNYTARPARSSAVMEFRGAQLEPYVIGVHTQQTVWLRNTDPVLHNAHIMPRAPGARERNLGMPTTKAALREPWYQAIYRRFVLRRPPPMTGVPLNFYAADPFVQIKCDVHPWEYGYICVVDHPFFAVTDANGYFAFPPGLPPGKYEIEVRHLKTGRLMDSITLKRGERKKLEYTLRVIAPPTNSPGATR